MSVEISITPTLTLAQLYETQKEYFGAYAIYSLMYKENPSDDIGERLKAVEEKMFSHHNLVYDQRLDLILTPAEKEMFRILPEVNYLHLKKSLQNIPPIPREDPEEFEEIEEESEEIDIEFIPQSYPEGERDDKIMQTINNLTDKKKAVSASPRAGIFNSELTIAELYHQIIDLFGSDKKISELTLQEIGIIIHYIQS